MKKGLLLLVFLGFSCIYAEYEASKNFNVKSFYEDHKKKNSENPNDFQTQELLGNTMSEKEFDLSKSGNAQALKDEEISNYIDKDDRKISKHYMEIQNLEGTQSKSLTDYLKEKMALMLGEGVVGSTQKVSCYIARSQSFYQYTCDLRQGSVYGQGMDNTQSPEAIKELCMKDCYKTSTCELAEPTAGQQQDITFASFGINKSNPDKRTFESVIDKKIEFLEFSFEGKQDIKISFLYRNKENYEKVLANSLIVKKNDDGQAVKKQYMIKDFIKSYKLVIEPTDESKLENSDIFISDLKLTIKGAKHWVCLGDNIRAKSGILKLCRPDDIVEFRMQNGDIVEVCKSQNEADNGDGSYSTEELCMASCRVEGECTLVPPILSPEAFFGFSEGCLTGDKNCSTDLCTQARENLAPILNEWVYDGEGNRIQTIKNGIPVSGVVRPRILASQAQDYQQKIQEETKELARQKMVQEQTYVHSKAIGEERQTSYASKVDDNKKLSFLIKPSNTLYSKTANLYVVFRVATTTPDWKIDKDLSKNFTSEYYYILNSSGGLYPFYRKQGIGIEGKVGQFQTFNGNSWKNISDTSQAPISKSYYDVYSEVQKHKYYIEFPFVKTTEIASKISGIPYTRKFKKANKVVGDITGDNGYEGGSGVNTDGITDEKKLEQIVFSINYGYKSNNFLGEIYNKNELEAMTQAQKAPYAFYAGDFMGEIQAYTILTDETLTYSEILEKVRDYAYEENKYSKNDFAVWNDLGGTRGIKKELKGDESEENNYYKIYLVGEANNLSVYANIKTASEDKGENAYFFLWNGELNKKDRGEGSIVNIETDDSLKIHDYKNALFSKYDDYVIFENKDYTGKEKVGIGFGYGTGKFENKDCKTFKSSVTGKTERICLPWWKIEREYDKKDGSQLIQNAEINKALTQITTPMEGKRVKVCTKVDPYANAIYNSSSKIVTCTSYYSKLVSKSCAENPKQAECFIDNCSIAVKNNCKKRNVFEFTNANKGVFVKTDDEGNSYEDLDDTKVDVKGYSYECPSTSNITINHKCLETQEVIMNPANCGDTDVVEEDDILKGKSGWIYCDKNKAIYDSKGVIQGFEGICPSGKKVVCGVNQLKSITKVCKVPTYEDVVTKVVSSKTIKRSCQDVYVDVGAGEVDVYKDSDKCYRINSSDDARGGTHKIDLRVNGRVPTMRFSAVNESQKGGREDDIFCIKTGDNSKLPSNCQNNSSSGKFVVDTSYEIDGDSQILFVEQIGGVDNTSGDIGGITTNDTFDIWNTFRFEKKNVNGQKGWVESNTGGAKNGNGETNFWNNPKTHAGLSFPNVKHRKSDFNFYADSFAFSTKGFKINVFPDVNTYNFQFLTKECTKTGYHDHYWNWRIFHHTACGGGCDSLGHCSDDGDHWWDDHLVSRDEKALKVYKNAVVGLTILFPSVSSYEITYFNRDNEEIMTELIDSTRMKTNKVGALQNIGFGSRIISTQGKYIRDVLIPAKEEEIKKEQVVVDKIKARLTRLNVTSSPTYSKTFCSWWGNDGQSCRTEYSCNPFPEDSWNGGGQGDGGGGFRSIERSLNFWEQYRGWEEVMIGTSVCIKAQNPPRNWTNTIRSAGTYCFLDYDKNKPINSSDGKNQMIDCNFENKLNQLKAELTQLKADYKEESVYTCHSDMFSPVGGGTHFKLGSGSKHISCDPTRSMDYIKKNSIYRVIIKDLDTGKTFEKALTFPLPYINRIYFTYLKEVDRRAYRCCEDF